MTSRQALAWGATFLVVIGLVILFFVYGRQVPPVLGALPEIAWPISWS